MRSGPLDRVLTLQKKTPTQDTYGEEIYTWTEVAKIWGQRKDLRGSEFYTAQQLESKITATFRTRFRSDITPGENRIVYDDVVYDIQAVIELGRREALELMVIARV